MLLAIDTATRFIGLALHDGRDLLAEQTWQTNNNHTIQLAPAVRALLENAEVVMDELTALAVSIGPGSYTGLRIGVALAKGLASARHLPLIGVTTLDTLAAGHPYYGSSTGLVAVVQAGRGRIIVKTYRWRKGEWSSRAEPQLMAWESLLDSIDGPAYITGEINEVGFETLVEAQGREVPISIAPAAHRLRRPGYLAQLAWNELNAAEDKAVFSPSKLTPLYVKSDDTP